MVGRAGVRYKVRVTKGLPMMYLEGRVNDVGKAKSNSMPKDYLRT